MHLPAFLQRPSMRALLLVALSFVVVLRWLMSGSAQPLAFGLLGGFLLYARA